jgi:hypothetical protein
LRTASRVGYSYYMGLLSIFKKRKNEEAAAVPSDSIKALSDGILFEGENVFLKWGSDIQADKRYIKQEYRADRTIYQWGERAILNGLKLPFRSVCWNQRQHGDIKSFESIEFSAEGGETEVLFGTIRKHLESIFGEPKAHEDLQPGDMAFEWKIKAVKVDLKFFNKEKPTVHFEVGWWV